ncbi:MAG: hypothetical protein LBO04_05275, partial [Spirochaetaceae bacterium]|nr:hypothetical protein [Spirochaetaceae bacterium]
EAGTDEAPADEAPADEAGTDEAPADEAPADEAGTDEAGTDEAGTDEAGTDEAGTDEAGTDEAGTDEAPADEAPADEAGTDEAGTDEAGTEAEAASVPDQVSVDLDLTETPDQSPPAGAAFDDFADDSGASAETPLEDIVVPALDEADVLPDAVPVAPDYLSPDDLVDINEGLAGPPASFEPAPVPQDEPETAAPAQSARDPLDTAHFKKELQIVLSYMDKLLEALPDEKIEEFARSEQFDIYKKVFKELGLV